MYGPDFSSSDEDLADDPDYELYKEKLRNNVLSYQTTKVDEHEEKLKQLYYSILNGQSEEVVRLLDSGIKNDVTLENVWTPLLLACSVGKVTIVKALIHRGCNINLTKDSLTPLMLACDCPEETNPFEDTLKTIELLLENGAEVNAVDKKRKTALMYASFRGNLEAVKNLLPLSNKLAEDNQKWTALFWAVYGNAPTVVKFLLDNDFPTDVVDIREKSPLDTAREYELLEVIELFPKEEADEILEIINSYPVEFQDIFKDLRPQETPSFFLDVCSILYGTESQNLVKLFSKENVDLKTLLSYTDSELIDIGVELPLQRRKLLTGLYKLHKRPFLLKSLPRVQKNGVYSTLDTAGAVLSAMKQLTVMEASIKFIRKNMEEKVSEEDSHEISLLLLKIKERVGLLQNIVKHLNENVQNWENTIKPVDLITKSTRKRTIPWIKITFILGTSLFILLKTVPFTYS